MLGWSDLKKLVKLTDDSVVNGAGSAKLGRALSLDDSADLLSPHEA